MSDDGDLTLLLETLDPVELASVRSLLDGHDIKYVVQGEHHASMVRFERYPVRDILLAQLDARNFMRLRRI